MEKRMHHHQLLQDRVGDVVVMMTYLTNQREPLRQRHQLEARLENALPRRGTEPQTGIHGKIRP
eukprot:2493010-Amphidinium_carterae.1